MKSSYNERNFIIRCGKLGIIEFTKVLYKKFGFTEEEILNLLKADIDKGKCTTCKHHDTENYKCVVGSYWAEKGINTFCYYGKLFKILKY